MLADGLVITSLVTLLSFFFPRAGWGWGVSFTVLLTK